MTDSNANGPEGTANADAANADAAAAATTDNRAGETATTINGSNGDGGDWLAGLSEENRSLVEAKKWDGDPNALVKGYRELESHAKSALVPPGDDASPDDWSAFYDRLGRPEKPEGYEFRLPEGVPEDMPYDDTLKAQFQTWAHESGLTPKQAAMMHDFYVQQAGQTYTDAVEWTGAKVTAAHDALVKVWGDPETEGHKRNVELAGRAIRQLGGDALQSELTQFGFMTERGEVTSALITQMFAKIGEQLYVEDAVYAGPTASVNPFADGPHHNLTEQGKILRSDPKRAKALIQAAGQDPALYRL